MEQRNPRDDRKVFLVHSSLFLSKDLGVINDSILLFYGRIWDFFPPFQRLKSLPVDESMQTSFSLQKSAEKVEKHKSEIQRTRKN